MAVSVEARPAPAKAMAVSVEARPVPAKAMPVSVEARPAPANAIAVSGNRAPPACRAPEGPEGHAAKPVGGGGAWPGDQWTADVTNVVKPTQFKSPNEDPCYKRRQSEAKNHYFSQKCRRIDDVCNKRRKNRTISSSD